MLGAGGKRLRWRPHTQPPPRAPPQPLQRPPALVLPHSSQPAAQRNEERSVPGAGDPFQQTMLHGTQPPPQASLA